MSEAEKVKPTISKLLQMKEADLQDLLARRALAIGTDESLAGSFQPKFHYDVKTMGTAEENLREYGEQLFNRLNKSCYDLICGQGSSDSSQRSQVLSAFHLTPADLASALTVLLITHLAVAPPLAVVIASLIVTRVGTAAHGALCDVWSKNLPAAVSAVN